MDKLKTVLLCTCFVIGLLPSFGQTPDGSPQVIFRFVEGKDMFYVPWNGNGAALDSLCLMVDPDGLQAGSVRVDGYSATKQLSMVRCNRVKSELILRRGLTEDHFTTTNNVGKFQGMANVVIVTLPVMKAAEVAQAMEQATEPEQPAVTEPESEEIAVETQPQEPQDTDEVATPAETVTETQEPAPIYNKERSRDFGSLALRANLLRWATLTPDLGLEWRVSRTWAVLVHGSWTLWSWDDKNRCYALWEVAPEVRWYLDEREAWYLGVMGKVGHFNYKFSETGRLGDIMGGGLTGGYMLRLNDAFSLDFGLGIGYLRADFDEYVVIDNVRVRSGEGSKNWWGPVHAGVTLVWTLF